MRDVAGVLQRALSDEIIYARPERLRVFVSSQIREGILAAERQAAVEAIESHPDYRAWVWERDSAAGPYSSAKVCVKQAQTSDALVLLLADDLTPVTAKEYRAAGRAGVPRFVFLKDVAARTEAAEKFVTLEQRRRIVTENFGNVAEMKTQILNAIRTYTRMAHRRSIAEARARRP